MEIREMAKIIRKNGGNIYLVGGAVRDTILNREIKDEDYCVTGISQENFIKIFPEAKIQGKAFSVFILNHKEIALARKETKIGKGHKEFEIETNEKITIEEDLQRRDITINSMAQDILSKEIIDPFGGRKDLENRIIKATSHKFKEDPLRVYRVARMAATLNFDVDKDTIKLMHSLKDELTTLSKERVFMEFKRALETEKPSIFFQVLKQAKVLDVHFKEIHDLIGAIQPKKYHPEGDSYNHTMLALDNSAKITANTRIRFCVLVHDLGKGRTPKEIYPHHYNHEKNGIEPLRELSNRLGVPNIWKKSAMTSVREHMKGGIFHRMTVAKKVSFIEKVDKSQLGLNGLQVVVYCDRCRDIEATKGDIIDERYNFIKMGHKVLKSVDGEYIQKKYGLTPGKEFGQRLHAERVNWLKKNINKFGKGG